MVTMERMTDDAASVGQAVGYVWASATGDDLAGQVQVRKDGIRRFAKGRGVSVAAWYVGTGSGGKGADHSALRELMQAVENGREEIGLVLVWSPDRLSSVAGCLAEVLDRLADAGVEVLTVIGSDHLPARCPASGRSEITLSVHPGVCSNGRGVLYTTVMQSADSSISSTSNSTSDEVARAFSDRR